MSVSVLFKNTTLSGKLYYLITLYTTNYFFNVIKIIERAVGNEYISQLPLSNLTPRIIWYLSTNNCPTNGVVMT